MPGALIELSGWEITHHLRPAVAIELAAYRAKVNDAREKDRKQLAILFGAQDRWIKRRTAKDVRDERRWRRLNALHLKTRYRPWLWRLNLRVTARISTLKSWAWLDRQSFPMMPLRITPIPYFATKPKHLDDARELMRAVKQRPTGLDKWSVPVTLWLHYRGQHHETR